MGLHWTLWLVLSIVVADASQEDLPSYPECKCDCQNRVPLDPSLLSCMTIYSMKSKGFITADEHYEYHAGENRYVFATNGNKKWETAKWFVYSKDSFNDSYALSNRYVNEWLYAGSEFDARDAYRRFVFTWVRNKELIPYEGHWQFIDDPDSHRSGIRIRNAWSGEYMYVDNEQHSQRYDYNRVYLWRHVDHLGTIGTQQWFTDNRFWFKLAKC